MPKNDKPTSADRDARGQTPGRKAFATAEEAWLWAAAVLRARRHGKPMPAGPCEPRDVFDALDRLYLQRILKMEHAYILRVWGERGASPSPASAYERSDALIWREALDRLEPLLISQGIVAPPEAHA